MGALRWSIACLLLAALASGAFAQDRPKEPEPAPAPAAPAAIKPVKGIGEVAPRPTDVEWLLGKPLKQLARGTAYVIVFWAPWDADSVRSLRVLAELQKSHASQRVSVVAIVLGDRPEFVPADGFVQRRVAALPFVVALDVLDKTRETWDALVGVRIPMAVIVDRSGRIAWRGNPLGPLEPALAAVLADDKATAERLMAERRELGEKLTPLFADLQKYAAADGMEARCCDLLDQVVALDAPLSAGWVGLKYSLLRKQKKLPEAAAWGRRLVSELLRDDEVRLNELAWSIVDPDAKDKEIDLELARLAAERSNELAGGQEAAILDTLAHVRWREGQVDEAVKLETKAIELAWTAETRKVLNEALARFQAPP